MRRRTRQLQQRSASPSAAQACAGTIGGTPGAQTKRASARKQRVAGTRGRTRPRSDSDEIRAIIRATGIRCDEAESCGPEPTRSGPPASQRLVRSRRMRCGRWPCGNGVKIGPLESSRNTFRPLATLSASVVPSSICRACARPCLADLPPECSCSFPRRRPIPARAWRSSAGMTSLRAACSPQQTGRRLSRRWGLWVGGALRAPGLMLWGRFWKMSSNSSFVCVEVATATTRYSRAGRGDARFDADEAVDTSSMERMTLISVDSYVAYSSFQDGLGVASLSYIQYEASIPLCWEVFLLRRALLDAHRASILGP